MYADVEMCILVEGSMQQNSRFADKITLKNSKSKSYAYEWITKQVGTRQVGTQYKKIESPIGQRQILVLKKQEFKLLSRVKILNWDESANNPSLQA